MNRHKPRHPARRAALGCLTGLAGLAATGQEAANFLTNELPYPDYMPVTRDHYNLRWGDLTVRLDASLAANFTDNAFLAEEDKTSDWGLTPLLNIGFFYPIREEQTLQLDFGVGYTWWNERSDQSGLTIAPRSHLSFRQRVGQVDLTLSNTSSTSMDGSSRVELAGEGTEFSFERLYNVVSLGAGWQPTRRLAFNGGYSFSIDRTLNDDFGAQDRDTHSFNAGVDFIQSELLSYGLGGSYSFFNYLENIQNDGDQFFVGPNVEWRPRDYLTVNLEFGYSQLSTDQTGAQPTDGDFTGLTFSGNTTYRMNRYLTHNLGVFRSVEPGFGNDYTEQIGANYSAVVPLSRQVTATARASYTNAKLSNDEEADLWSGGLGIGWNFIRRVTTGLDWTINTRGSNQENRSYTENVIALRLGYQF